MISSEYLWLGGGRHEDPCGFCVVWFAETPVTMLELKLLGRFLSDISSWTFSLCSILTAEHPCSDAVLDKLSTLEDRFSINLKICLCPNSAFREPNFIFDLVRNTFKIPFRQLDILIFR